MAEGLTSFYFGTAMMARDTFKVVRFQGEEAISQPFSFEIDLICEDPEIDLDEILNAGAPAYLVLKTGDARRWIFGIPASVEQLGEAVGGLYYYRIVLVPRLWLLTLSEQSQIYQNRSTPAIVAAELAGAGLTDHDFAMMLTRDYPVWEYRVQYKESDLNFISRILEHEGIFYFFVHEDGADRLIFTDDNLHLPAVEDPFLYIPYRPLSGMAARGEAIHDFVCKNRRRSRAVVLKDFNYRRPDLRLFCEAQADENGHGLVSRYGDHFKSPEEGQALAAVRAEEIRCRKRVFTGRGACCGLRPGFRFNLVEHFREDFNREYLVTRVTHSGEQAVAGASGAGQGAPEATVYRNEFHCIPSDTPFRPERLTPKPRLYGIMNAYVDAGFMETRAEIDEEGRYKVIMPFDLSGAGKGRASRYVRMAQPYGGRGNGMHFPLLKGTEVIWTCIDGDPDRPIIIGVPPNPLNPSPVTSANSTRNTIRTTAGILMEFDDGMPGEEGGEDEEDDDV